MTELVLLQILLGLVDAGVAIVIFVIFKLLHLAACDVWAVWKDSKND